MISLVCVYVRIFDNGKYKYVCMYKIFSLNAPHIGRWYEFSIRILSDMGHALQRNE